MRSNTIAQAFQNKMPDFRAIEVLAERINKLVEERDNIRIQVCKIYAKCFRNLVSKKTEAGVIDVESDYYGTETRLLFLTREGLATKKDNYYHGATPLTNDWDVFEAVIRGAYKNKNKIMAFIPRPEKAFMFEKFVEPTELTNWARKEATIFPDAIRVSDYKGDAFEVESMEMKGMKLYLNLEYLDGRYKGKDTQFFEVRSIEMRYRILVEQLFDEIMAFLEVRLKMEQDNLEKAKLYLEKINENMSPYLTVLQLMKERKQ